MGKMFRGFPCKGENVLRRGNSRCPPGKNYVVASPPAGGRSIRKSSLDFPSAIWCWSHFGSRPLPDQVSTGFSGLRYFGEISDRRSSRPPGRPRRRRPPSSLIRVKVASYPASLAARRYSSNRLRTRVTRILSTCVRSSLSCSSLMFSRSKCSPLCADRAITHSTVSRN
jgi:hypothetical protein